MRGRQRSSSSVLRHQHTARTPQLRHHRRLAAMRCRPPAHRHCTARCAAAAQGSAPSTPKPSEWRVAALLDAQAHGQYAAARQPILTVLVSCSLATGLSAAAHSRAATPARTATAACCRAARWPLDSMPRRSVSQQPSTTGARATVPSTQVGWLIRDARARGAPVAESGEAHTQCQ